MATAAPPVIPSAIADGLAIVDKTWLPVLRRGLEALAWADPAYLPALAQDDYLPTQNRLFAAFAMPLDCVRYVLVGEGPYPRAESATGVCFMDGAVGSLWSESGLSKQVNRATSLRNFMKMLLVADKQLQPAATSGTALAPIAARALVPDSGWVQSLPDLQDNLIAHGFLLLNAALVYRPHVAPVKDAKAWRPFLQVVLAALATKSPAPTLVLWGKIAEQLRALPETENLPQVQAEHPYNLSFIDNQDMQRLFGAMHLLRKNRNAIATSKQT